MGLRILGFSKLNESFWEDSVFREFTEWQNKYGTHKDESVEYDKPWDRYANILWKFKESNDYFKLRVSGRIRESNMIREVLRWWENESFIWRKQIEPKKLKEILHINRKQWSLWGQWWEIKVGKVILGSVTRYEMTQKLASSYFIL